MQLSNEQIITLNEAINRLDGQRAVRLIEGKPVETFESYHLAWSARWILAQAQNRLQSAIADFATARDVLINRHSNGAGQIGVDHANFKQFSSELACLKRENINLDLAQITLDQLELEKNERAGHGIPISILAALQPLIKQPLQ